MPVQINAVLKDAPHAPTPNPNDKLVSIIGQSAVDELDCIAAANLHQDLSIMERYAPAIAIACRQVTATHLCPDLSAMERCAPTKAIACGQITTKK